MACITKRRDRWVIDFYDQTGKRRWKTLPEGTTKGKAHEQLRAIEDMLAKGLYLPTKKIPLFSEVAKDWLEQKQANVRESTYKSYQGHLKCHLSYFNALRINKINTVKVEKFISELQSRGMNLTTLRKVIVTFNQVMQYAVRHKYIDHNPVRDAERPRGRGGEEKPLINFSGFSSLNTALSRYAIYGMEKVSRC